MSLGKRKGGEGGVRGKNLSPEIFNVPNCKVDRKARMSVFSLRKVCQALRSLSYLRGKHPGSSIWMEV